jgi:hypothetical protein
MGEPGRRSRLSARAFYGVIAAGFLLGAGLGAATTWLQLGPSSSRPPRDGFDALTGGFAVLVSPFIGGTFGGLAGVAAAVAVDRWRKAPPT